MACLSPPCHGPCDSRHLQVTLQRGRGPGRRHRALSAPTPPPGPRHRAAGRTRRGYHRRLGAGPAPQPGYRTCLTPSRAPGAPRGRGAGGGSPLLPGLRQSPEQSGWSRSPGKPRFCLPPCPEHTVGPRGRVDGCRGLGGWEVRRVPGGFCTGRGEGVTAHPVLGLRYRRPGMPWGTAGSPVGASGGGRQPRRGGAGGAAAQHRPTAEPVPGAAARAEAAPCWPPVGQCVSGTAAPGWRRREGGGRGKELHRHRPVTRGRGRTESRGDTEEGQTAAVGFQFY